MTRDPIADLFEQVVEQLHPEVDRILEGGEQRGRRMRTRRRLRLAAAGTLTLTAVVGVAVGLYEGRTTAPTALAGASGTSAPANRSPSALAGSRSPAMPSPGQSTATKQSAPAVGSGMSRERMLDTLRSLLPAGAQFSHVSTSTGPGSLEVDYDDGHGAVDLMLTISPTSTMKVPLTCPDPLWTDEGTRPAGALPISCAMRTPPGGGLERDAVTYADSFGFYGYNIYDQRPDGVTVFIQVGNGINHTLPQVDRATPPGTMQQWTAVVENPVWTL